MTEKKLYLIQHIERDRIIESDYHGKHKLGISQSPEKRARTLAGGTPHELRLLTTVEIIGDTQTAESILHQYFHSGRVAKEWFRLGEKVIDALIETDTIAVDTLHELKRKKWTVKDERDILNDKPMCDIRDRLFQHEVLAE